MTVVPSVGDLRRRLVAAVGFLEESQEADGGFPVAALLSQPPATAADNLFSTATVVALAGSALRAACVARAASYILGRRDGRGLWAWVPDGSLPPDADDTACCLAALARTGSRVDRGRGVQLLRSFWRPGGPFRTWLAGGAWDSPERDDPVVNCNVLWAMRELGALHTAAERAAVERMVAPHRGNTRYYCSEASVAWAAARVGIPAPRLRPPRDADLAGRPLECALWSLAGGLPPAAAARLLETQEADGGWPAEPWVHDHLGAWGSRAVTAAFAIAALSNLVPPGWR
ncbi:MAG: hypothetical protein ACJ8GN_21140 [Longimicrobiaceae bacterium]